MGVKILYYTRLYFRLLYQYGKMDLQWLLRDTKYFLITITAEFISAVASVTSVFLLSERFGNIGGMTKDQILFMLGYASAIDGAYIMFIGMNNIGFMSRIIGRGQIDHKLIQPVPLWIQFATEGFLPVSGNSTLLWGIALTVYSVIKLNIAVTPLWIVYFIMNLFCSFLIIFSASTIMGTLAFYAPVAAEEVSTTVIDFFNSVKSYPIGGLPYGLQLTLCTVLPSGLAAWLPANVLLGHTPEGFAPILTVIEAVLLSTITSITFKKGLNHYGRYGSARYLSRGHRS